MSFVDFATPKDVNNLHITTIDQRNHLPSTPPRAPPRHNVHLHRLRLFPPRLPLLPLLLGRHPRRRRPRPPAPRLGAQIRAGTPPPFPPPLPPSSQTKLTTISPQHYELIPHPTLSAAESSLRDEIGPFVALLLDRADKHLARQARRIETLKARADLNAGRLSHVPAPTSNPAPVRKSGKRLDGEAALRAKVVRGRKEALQYGVERLELEVLQKERELKVRVEAGRGR